MLHSFDAHLPLNILHIFVSIGILICTITQCKHLIFRAFKYICQLPSFAMHLTSFSVRFKVSCLVSAVLPMLVPAAMKQTALDISSSSGCSSMDESETPNPEMMQILYDIIANVTMDIQCVTLAARYWALHFRTFVG